MVWPDQGSNQRSTVLEGCTVTITPPMQFWPKYYYFALIKRWMHNKNWNLQNRFITWKCKFKCYYSSVEHTCLQNISQIYSLNPPLFCKWLKTFILSYFVLVFIFLTSCVCGIHILRDGTFCRRRSTTIRSRMGRDEFNGVVISGCRWQFFSTWWKYSRTIAHPFVCVST